MIKSKKKESSNSQLPFVISFTIAAEFEENNI
jgi:hypothetical protein